MERPPALHADERDLRGAEEQRVDLVEVPVRGDEHRAERLAVVLRRRRRDALDDRLELVVARVDRELDQAAVEDGVVRAADRGAVVLGDRRQRARPVAADDAADVEVDLVQLVERRLDDARRDLHAAGAAPGRREGPGVGARGGGGAPGAPRALSATDPASWSGGASRVSRQRTAALARSSTSRSSYRSSARVGARPGPLAIAKYPSRLICQPAYWAARQASAGWSVTTTRPGIERPATTTGANATQPRPPIVISAKRRPASSPPATALPQSITRVPPRSVVTATRSASASS